MNVYRVFPYDAAVPRGQAGHPLFVPTGGFGRVDNRGRYRVLYASTHDVGAIAEALGRFPEWTSDRLVHSNGSRLALQAYRIDDARITNLDDAHTLVRENLRPSRVVTRDRKVTQAWSLRIFERNDADGVAWWSYYNPDWLSVGVWNVGNLASVGATDNLTIFDPRVRDAAKSLRRIIR